MGKKIKYAAGATMLAGAGALAYKKWQEDEELQHNLQDKAKQVSNSAQQSLWGKSSESTQQEQAQARSQEEAPLE